jgi:hypothetical protein
MAPYFWDTFSTENVIFYFFTKNVLGNILGDLFVKLPGHPGRYKIWQDFVSKQGLWLSL